MPSGAIEGGVMWKKIFNIFLKKAETEVEEMPVFKEYAIDFKTGKYIKEGNDIKVLEKNEALKVLDILRH